MIKRTAVISFCIIVAGAIAGYFAATGVNDFLSISFMQKSLPDPASAIIWEDTVSHELQLRIVDFGGVGIIPDTAAWGNNYDHNQYWLEDVMLAEPPFINPEAFSREKQKLDIYSKRMADYGYNAIAMPWFLEFINFEMFKNGNAIYAPNSIYKKRHEVLRAHFRELMAVCDSNGLRTYLWTDMVMLTTPLRDYLESEFGTIDTENPEFWKVYEAAAAEAFEYFPDVDGLIIRIGEAGTIYNKPGWDYYSDLLIRSDKGVQNMLNVFLEAAGSYDKDIIFRTWSVGVGEIGDMHTNPETYNRVLGEISSNNLIVSTKYCRGDFYSWHELNPTLITGKHRRIAELQAKREFEGFGAIPNYVAPLHQVALQSFIEGNPRFEGVWVWTQYGGPLRAGPMIIYPFTGFNVINDANVYASSQLMMDPYADLSQITDEWISLYFGEDSILVDKVSDCLMKSYEVMSKGLYISDFAKYDVKALGLEPPPMLWIFEWDILSASSAVLSNIYYITRDKREKVVEEGFEAVRAAGELKNMLLEVKDSVSKNQKQYDQLIAAAAYEQDLFNLLAYYRQFFMRYYYWLDTGNSGTNAGYKLALGQFKAMKDFHEAKYSADLNTLGMEFFEVNQGIRVAERTPISVISGKIILVLILFLFLMGIPGLRTSRGSRKFAAALLFDSVFRPHKISKLNKYYRSGLMAFLSIFLFASGIFVFTSFSGIVFPASIIILALFYILLLDLISGEQKDFLRRLVSLMGPKLVFMAILMAFVAYRSPMFFWFKIWTSDLFRTLFFIVFILLIFRRIHVNIIAVKRWSERNALGSAGLVFLVMGIQILIAGVALQFFGLERSLTVLNDELIVLPGGLSRILGITTHLGIPLELPIWIIIFSMVVTAAGFMLFIFNRKKLKTLQKYRRN